MLRQNNISTTAIEDIKSELEEYEGDVEQNARILLLENDIFEMEDLSMTQIPIQINGQPMQLTLFYKKEASTVTNYSPSERHVVVHGSQPNDPLIDDESATKRNLRHLEIHGYGTTTYSNDLRSLDRLSHIQSTLTILRICHSGLQEFNCNGLKLDNLQVLSLRGNDLRTLELSSKDIGSKLRVLDISYNKLTNDGLQNINFSQFQKLESLHLQHNLLSSTNFIHSFPELLELDLSENNMAAFELPRECGKLPKLLHLDISRNLLSELNSERNDLDKKMPNLKQLNLSNNGIQSIRGLFTNCSNLTHLHLGNNLLDNVQASDFPRSITFMDLSGNLFSKLDNLTFRSLASLQLILLNDNPWDDSHQFDFENNGVYIVPSGSQQIVRIMNGVPTGIIVEMTNLEDNPSEDDSKWPDFVRPFLTLEVPDSDEWSQASRQLRELCAKIRLQDHERRRQLFDAWILSARRHSLSKRNQQKQSPRFSSLSSLLLKRWKMIRCGNDPRVVIDKIRQEFIGATELFNFVERKCHSFEANHEHDSPSSDHNPLHLVLTGPPGCGKTSGKYHFLSSLCHSYS